MKRQWGGGLEEKRSNFGIGNGYNTGTGCVCSWGDARWRLFRPVVAVPVPVPAPPLVDADVVAVLLSTFDVVTVGVLLRGVANRLPPSARAIRLRLDWRDAATDAPDDDGDDNGVDPLIVVPAPSLLSGNGDGEKPTTISLGDGDAAR